MYNLTFWVTVGRLHALGERVQGALIAFVRTGCPGASSLPDWSAYDTIRRATMLLDEVSRIVDGPDAPPADCGPTSHELKGVIWTKS